MVNTGEGYELKRCRDRSADTLAGVSYELDDDETPYLGSYLEDPKDPHPIFEAVVIRPEVEKLNLAFNSYDVESCNTRKHELPRRERRIYRIPEGNGFAEFWNDVVDTWIDNNQHWGAKSWSTTPENAYHWGHEGHLEMPENVWEALRWIEKGRTAEKNIPVSPEKPATRRPPYREEHQEHRSTHDRSTWKLLTAPPPTPRLPLNLFDFSSPKGNMVN